MNTVNPKKVLVTGLSGMVGSRFAQLFDDKYEFVNLDLTNGIDITNAESVNQIFDETQAKTIIHLAAFTNVSAAHEQQGDKTGSCYQVNVIGTETIARAAAAHQAYMIHISTDYVFDGTKTESYTEADQPHPIEWYGQTKWWAEQAVGESQTKHIILRLAFPYQAKPSRPDFVAKIIDNLKQNTLPPAFTDHILTPTFTDNVALVFDYCIQEQPTGLYHMVGSSSLTDFEIATQVKQVFGLEAEVKPGSLAAYLAANPRPYQQTMKISNAKLQAEFGINMASFEAGLRAIKQQLG